MANYVRNGYRAIPEITSRRGNGEYIATVRLYRYPGELVEIESHEFTRETRDEARKLAVAWVTQNMNRFKG